MRPEKSPVPTILKNVLIHVRIPSASSDGASVVRARTDDSTVCMIPADGGREREVRVDKVYDGSPLVRQDDVFEGSCLELVEHSIAGGNACLIAYGCANSGKSHSLMGGLTSGKDRGLIVRAAERLFLHYQGAQVRIFMEWAELYQDRIRDLGRPYLHQSTALVEHASSTQPVGSSSSALQAYLHESLSLKQDAPGAVYVKGLTRLQVQSATQIASILEVGRAHRKSIDLALGRPVSDAGHTILTLTIVQPGESTSDTRACALQFVELAAVDGFTSKDSNTAELTKDRNTVRSSLGAIQRAIVSFSAGSIRSVTVSEHKLTRLLQPSWSPGSIVTILAHVDTRRSALEESNITLSFVEQCMLVRNGLQVLLQSEGADHLLEKCDALQAELDKKRTELEQCTKTYQFRLNQLLGDKTRIPDVVDSSISKKAASTDNNVQQYYEFKAETMKSQIEKLTRDTHDLQSSLIDQKSRYFKEHTKLAEKQRILENALKEEKVRANRHAKLMEEAFNQRITALLSENQRLLRQKHAQMREASPIALTKGSNSIDEGSSQLEIENLIDRRLIEEKKSWQLDKKIEIEHLRQQFQFWQRSLEEKALIEQQENEVKEASSKLRLDQMAAELSLTIGNFCMEVHGRNMQLTARFSAYPVQQRIGITKFIVPKTQRCALALDHSQYKTLQQNISKAKMYIAKLEAAESLHISKPNISEEQFQPIAASRAGAATEHSSKPKRRPGTAAARLNRAGRYRPSYRPFSAAHANSAALADEEVTGRK